MDLKGKYAVLGAELSGDVNCPEWLSCRLDVMKANTYVQYLAAVSGLDGKESYTKKNTVKST